MGRRAADLTTPVPVLGVPALVGVRGWRTTAGDRTGGALLQNLGPPCSVSVQTSPGISRPPTQHSVQLTDTLSTPSDNITQTPNSYITKETEYREISLLTKSDKEKRVILKQKTGESKTKKEVTFKAPADEAPRDITSSQKNSSRTYCYAKTIKTNPHFAANVTSVKPKLKSVRYTNGSVVDSEAIGGISIDNGEGEPVKSSISRGRNQTKLQGDFLERAGKTLLLSTAKSSGMPQQICSHCGGRQSVTTSVIAPGEKSSTVDACLGENGITSPLTTTHFHMAQIEKNLKLRLYETSKSITDRKKTMHVADNPELLYLSEELKHRKMPHPACPVHSRRNLAPLLQTHAASDATPTQPSTILRAKSITVTTATIETRPDDSCTKSFAKPPQDRKIQQPTSLMSTPQMATATKSNNPHLHTYPKHLRIPKHNSTQHNMPQSVCVSVHATPENSLLPSPSLYTTAMGSGNISIISTQKRTLTLNTTLMATESIPAKVAQHENQCSTWTAQINTATDTTNSPQTTLKSPTVPLVASALVPSGKRDTSTQSASVIQCSPCSPLYKPIEKPLSDNDVKPTAKASILDSDLSALDTTTHEPQLPLTTVVQQNTLHHDTNSDQIMPGALKPAYVDAQNHSIKPKYSNSEPTLHVSLASQNTTHNTNPLDSKVRLLSAVSPNYTSICRSIQYKKIALRKSSVNFKKPPPTATASSSTMTENQRNICASGTISLQSAEATQHSSKLSCNNATQHGHTQVRGGRTQTNNESGLYGAVLNQETNSTTNPGTLSELLIVSKHKDRDNDASNSHTAIITDSEWKNDKKKFNGNHISESVACEPKHHENSNPSQVTRLQNYSTLMKSNSSCLQGCMNTEPQWPAPCQTPTETEHEEYRATFPPVKTSQERDSNPQKFAVSLSVRNANIEIKSNADKQTLAHNPTPFDITKTKSEPVISSLKDTGAHVIPISESSVHQNSDSDSLLQQAHTSPELSFPPPPPLNSKGDHGTRTGPEWDSILPSSTLHLAYLPRLHSCKGEGIVRPDSKSSTVCPQWCPEDTSLAHSHPADAALLLPPSPQCCKSATLQQRLETVEASLAANKDRITTLLNIIHDLETCRTPSSR